MKKVILSLMLVLILIASEGVFAQSVEVVSVYPKAQFSSKRVSTSNFTATFSIKEIQGNYYLEMFLTNVSSTESIKINWQSVSLLLSGQAIKPNFEVVPPSEILAGSYVKANMKLSNNILSNSSILSVILPISISKSTTTYEIRLQVQPLAYSPQQPSVPQQHATYAFKQHLWDFPLQWGIVNFNEKGQAVSTTAGLLGIPFLALEQKNFFSPLHAGINTYWGYDTVFGIIPASVNIGADYVANGDFYVGIGLSASWIYLLTPSSSYYDESYTPQSPVYPTLTIGTYY